MHTTLSIDHPDTFSIPYGGRPCFCERCGGTHHLRRDGSDFVLVCSGHVVLVAHAGFFLPHQSDAGELTQGPAGH
jgi:hypothetical protein